ncbi:hypothetical protein Peur_008854 [Populus x canadensis]
MLEAVIFCTLRLCCDRDPIMEEVQLVMIASMIFVKDGFLLSAKCRFFILQLSFLLLWPWLNMALLSRDLGMMVQ